MKRLFPLLTLLLSPFIASAAEAPDTPDTIMVSGTHAKVIESPAGVSVTLTGSAEDPNFRYSFSADYLDGTQVNVKKENDFNFDFPFSKNGNTSGSRKYKRWTLHTGGILLGFAGSYNLPQGVKVNMGRSFEADWMNLLAAQFCTGYKAPVISVGFGLGCRNLTAKNSFRYVREEGDVVGLGVFPEEAKDCHTSISCGNLSFPLRVWQTLGKGWSCSVMASLDVLIHCSISSNYRIGDEYFSWKWTGVKKRTLGYSLVGALGNDDIGVFCKWTPKGMIKEGFGPQVPTISTGIIIGI